MNQQSERLRIAVLGAGNIGSTLAYHFARIGAHDVTVVARPGSPRLAYLQRENAIVRDDGSRAEVTVSDALDERIAYDLVIVTVLAHQVDAVLPALERCAAGCVQFMFNTFEPERLRAILGARCAFGMPFVQALIGSDGGLHVTVGGPKTIMDRQRWVDVFRAAGLPAALELRMPLWLRCHAPLTVAFESVCVAGERRGGGASWQEALSVAEGLRASFVLLERTGFRIYPRAMNVLYRPPAPFVAALFWSLSRLGPFRELLASGEAECFALVRAILAAAGAGVPAAVVASIASMVPAERVRP